MHTGEAMPVVAGGATLREAIQEMTRKGLGMTTVVRDDGRLVGIITDGDLRRLHMRGGTFDALRAGEAATRGPRTIGADDLAAKALEIMEGKITSLIVVDEGQRPRGVIHLHDILRAKII
jgi:arabinose-5-phosphate isomerase